MLACALSLVAGGCATRGPSRVHRPEASWSEQGLASWYGQAFHGRRTASGETFDMHALTAAHRTLPFGTRVRVTHLGNGRSVVVRINDRGPFRSGRIVDLSHAAALRLGMLGAGIAEVRLEPKRRT